jgi:hypothetical protein
MTEFEVLSRASAFLVKSLYDGSGRAAKHRFPKGISATAESPDLSEEQRMQLRKIQSFVPKYHVVTASHVVAPWLWPKYYPDEWLQHVNESHTHYTVELRDEDGVFVTQSECFPVSYHHQSRDLAVLHLEDEKTNIDMLREMEYEIPQLMMPPLANTEVDIAADDVGSDGEENTPAGDLYSYIRSDGYGGKLQFVGHNVTDVSDIGGLGGTLSGMRAMGDQRKPIPQRTLGALHGRTNAQIFCSTSVPLTDGMCGGPVLWDAKGGRAVEVDAAAEADSAGKGSVVSESSGASANDKSEVIVGMVEGIVPLDYQDKAMRGLAVFVESPIIHDFLDSIELGREGEELRLLGGQAVDHVAKTQHQSEFQMPIDV